jgi:glycosyltransferase involved in cell wall biosynthesis
VVHFRGSNFEAFYKQQSGWFKSYIVSVLNRCDKIILQANWVKEKFKQFVPEAKLVVIYNAVPAHEFAHIFRSAKNKNDNVKVLFLNHLSVAKGFVDFLEAAKQIVTERRNVDFYIGGDIINREKNILVSENGKKVEFQDIPSLIKQTQENSEWNRRINFLGEIAGKEQVLRLFQETDIFVLPSYSEGCPLSVLEAMASALPVIVTPVGALLELVKDGKNGLFAPIAQPTELKRKMLTLVDDPSLRQEMGKNNRLVAQSQLDIEIIVRQFSQLFNSL